MTTLYIREPPHEPTNRSGTSKMKNIMNIKATYGGKDCTAQIINRMRNSSISIKADNSIIGDPLPGTLKELIVTIDNIKYITPENEIFCYPELKLKKLGIWYSNNKTTTLTHIKSLESVQKSSSGKADIYTCVWNPIIENPFVEIVSWYKSSSHLNQILQIIQCLYVAKKCTKSEYEYVSFLEHDVLYPEGYFDYNNFYENVALFNSNYGGLSRDNWQRSSQEHLPMHQCTMRFTDALKHFLEILPNAIVFNGGIVEPPSPLYTRKRWRCKNESIHMNVGNHFTSHYATYTDTNRKHHPYWGDVEDYLKLFT